MHHQFEATELHLSESEMEPERFRNIPSGRSQNWIGRPGCTLNEADFVPPPTAEMLDALNELETYIHSHSLFPPLVRIGLIHYQFEAIHPFLDGNGRIGRILISLLLVNWNLLPSPLLYLSAFFERHRQTYYDLLFAASERGAWHEWLLFFLHGVAEQARDAIIRAKQLQDLRLAWRGRLMQNRASTMPLRLMDSLFNLPVLTIPEAQRTLNLTYRSAQRNVEKLVEAGLLRQVGELSYGRVFLAEDILRVVEEGHE